MKAKICGGKTMSNNSKHDRSFSLSLGVCGREVGTYWTKWIQQTPSLPILSLLASLEPNSGPLGFANTEKQCKKKKQKAHTFSSYWVSHIQF